jgi:hypothetical protein
MRRGARTFVVALGAPTLAIGCFLVTGGTGGYTLAPPEAGICTFDAAALGLGDALTCTCASIDECPKDAGPQFCCFGIQSATSVGSSCQSTPCDAATGAQLCNTTAECVDATCTAQTCSFSVVTIPVRACGSLAACTP